MGDYPDWTDLVQVVGADIMVPIDVQGAYIMLPVDIQAQYVTLEMDIVAQTIGNIDVDIAAQSVGNIAVSIAASAVTLDVKITASSVTLNVNIAASSVTLTVSVSGTAQIDIETQSVGVSFQGEWQVEQGKQKHFRGSGTNISSGNFATVVSYTVPSGKNLYVYSFCFAIRATDAADRNNNQIGIASLFRADAAYLDFGANGGGSYTLGAPMKVAAYESINLLVYNMANHNCNLTGSVLGYEV